MKKTLLTLLLVIGTPAAYAEGYSYLTFETTDGMKISVSVESLTLSISNNTLTAGSKTFTLSNLSKMFFSETDETATDIREVTSAALDDAIDIYDLQGQKVPKDKMRKGVYIVETKDRTYKIVVK